MGRAQNQIIHNANFVPEGWVRRSSVPFPPKSLLDMLTVKSPCSASTWTAPHIYTYSIYFHSQPLNFTRQWNMRGCRNRAQIWMEVMSHWRLYSRGSGQPQLPHPLNLQDGISLGREFALKGARPVTWHFLNASRHGGQELSRCRLSKGQPFPILKVPLSTFSVFDHGSS